MKSELVKAGPMLWGDYKYRMLVKHSLWIFSWERAYYGKHSSDMIGFCDWYNKANERPVSNLATLDDLDILFTHASINGCFEVRR